MCVQTDGFCSAQVTIPFSAVVLTNTYPVENSVFHNGIINTMRSIVPTLLRTGSKFSINLYPYFAYAPSSDIPLNLALGKQGSLFEAMLRGCRVALDKIGARSLPIIVGETGWPSAGGRGLSLFSIMSLELTSKIQLTDNSKSMLTQLLIKMLAKCCDFTCSINPR